MAGCTGWPVTLPAALSALDRAYAAAEAAADPNLGAYIACRMAQLLVAQGRFEDAVPWLEEAEPWDVVTNRSRVVGARARISAAAGEQAAADQVPRLLAMVAETRFLNIRIDAIIDAAAIMETLGRIDEALAYAARGPAAGPSQGELRPGRPDRDDHRPTGGLSGRSIWSPPPALRMGTDGPGRQSIRHWLRNLRRGTMPCGRGRTEHPGPPCPSS